MRRCQTAVEHCHDRTIAGMPLAAVGTAREHSFEFFQLLLCGIDDHRKRVIAAWRKRPLTIVASITLEQLHGALRRYRGDQSFPAKQSFS